MDNEEFLLDVINPILGDKAEVEALRELIISIVVRFIGIQIAMLKLIHIDSRIPIVGAWRETLNNIRWQRLLAV